MKTLLLVMTMTSCLAGVPASAQTAREVSYSAESVVPLKARLRFTTMIILPEQEEILDFVCGDKEFWIVSGGQNLAYVKPAKAGATTNLNLVTASGHVYSFVLTESAAEPDLKVFVKAEGAALAPAQGNRFYSAAEVAKLQRAAEDAQKEAEDARRQVDTVRVGEAQAIQEKVDQFRAAYPTELRFPYRFKAHQRPFNVSAIYTDGRFTYVRAEPNELPALYELLDATPGHQSSPNLVNFQVQNGVYIVPKVLERGYLAIGKAKLTFEKAR
jgi:type IV secretory pathway VirB9-like protein